jgi:ferredoxin
MRIIVNRQLCIGSGQCVLSAPELFDQSDDDGLVLLRVHRADATHEVRAAVDVCPSGALSLAEDQAED